MGNTSFQAMLAAPFLVAGLAAAPLAAGECGFEWRALEEELVPTIYPPYFYVSDLVAHDDGTGPAVFAAGTFGGSEGGVTSRGVARWDGTAWSGLGGGVDQWAVCLGVYDDGGGPELYVGGNFSLAGGVPAKGIARWDGRDWSAVGPGLTDPGNCAWCTYVGNLLTFEDRYGPALYATGGFTYAGTTPVNHIARWDGVAWSPLGTGLNGGSATAMVVFDDGGGPALYVSGNFENAGGVPGTRRIARWDGESWSTVGGGWNSQFDIIFDLEVFDDGSGPALYASGKFDYPGAPRDLARWDGVTWTRLGPIGNNNSISTLEVFDDGGGAALVAGGQFQSGVFGWQTTITVARWNVTGWTLFGPSLGYYVLDLLSLNEPGGPVLYAGGQYTVLGGAAAKGLATYRCRDDILPGDMDCDGSVSTADLPHFVQALVDPRWFTGCNTHRADVTGDGREDGQDVQAFLNVLTDP